VEGVEMKDMGSGWSRQTCQLHTRNIWYSEYSKRLPPVAFWRLQSAPNSIRAGAPPQTPLEKLTANPYLLA